MMMIHMLRYFRLSWSKFPSWLTQCCFLFPFQFIFSYFPAKMFFIDTPPSSRGFIERVLSVGSLFPWFRTTDEMEQGDVAGEVTKRRGVLVICGGSDVVGK